MNSLSSDKEVERIAKENHVSKRRARKIYEQMLSLLSDNSNHGSIQLKSIIDINNLDEVAAVASLSSDPDSVEEGEEE